MTLFDKIGGETTPLEDAVLSLLEEAGMDQRACDQIVGIIDKWQRGNVLPDPACSGDYDNEARLAAPGAQTTAGQAWKRYAADFNAMTDRDIKDENERCRREIEEHEDWLEAVASWEAAGRPRNREESDTHD